MRWRGWGASGGRREGCTLAVRRTVRHTVDVQAEQWSTEKVREFLGAKTIRSASRTLHRLGIAPVARQAGRSGMNLYDAKEVRAAVADRPGRGHARSSAKVTQN